TLRHEKRGRLFHALAALAIDDAALSGARTDERQDLAARIAAPTPLARRDLQVGANGRALEAGRLAHAELLEDVARDGSRGRGGEREHGYVELLLEPLQAAIGRPEVVSPLADAVRLVDYEQADRAPLHELAEITVERL